MQIDPPCRVAESVHMEMQRKVTGRPFVKGISGNPAGRLPRERVTPESLIRLADAIAENEDMSPERRLAAVMPLVRAGLGLVRPARTRREGDRARAAAKRAIEAAGDRPAAAAAQPVETEDEPPIL